MLLLITFRSINVDLRLPKANVEFLWWGGLVADGGWGLQSHFRVQPTFCVEVVIVVGVVTILSISFIWMNALPNINPMHRLRIDFVFPC